MLIKDEENIPILKLMTVEEVAGKLRCTEETIRDLIRQKKIRASKVGRWLIAEDDLIRFVRNHCNIKARGGQAHE